MKTSRRGSQAGLKLTRSKTEAIWKFARPVGDARLGAVTHPGAREERVVYMDL